MKPSNDITDIKIRKCQNILSVVGTGIVVMLVWDIAKYIGSFIAGDTYFQNTGIVVDNLNSTYSEGTSLVLAYIVGFLGLAVIVFFRLFTGVSAVAESRGRKTGRLYLFTGFMMILSNLSLIAFFVGALIYSFKNGYTTDFADGARKVFVSAIIELTSVVMLIEMFVSALRIRRLRKRRR